MSEEARIIGRVLKKRREAIQVETVKTDSPGASPEPSIVLRRAFLDFDDAWTRHPGRVGSTMLGISIRADLIDEVIELLQAAKASVGAVDPQ